jgi:phage tail-like protein
LSGQFSTGEFGTGRQMAMAPDSKEKLLTSAFFRIETMEGSADFSDLAGITSEVEQTEYMETGPVGPLFSRHPGRSKPPTVVLKRGMKTGTGTTWIWTWHKLARMGAPGMLRDTALLLYGPQDDPGGAPRVIYMLMNAFPTKLELAGMKMGGTEVVVQTLTLQCDDIFDPNAA